MSNRPSHQRIKNEAPKPAKRFAPTLTELLDSKFPATSLFDRSTKHTTNDITPEDVEAAMPQARTITSTSEKDQWVEHDESSQGSAEPIHLLNKVQVRHDIHTA